MTTPFTRGENLVFTFTDQEKILSVGADEDAELLEREEHSCLAVGDCEGSVENIWGGMPVNPHPSTRKNREGRKSASSVSLSSSSIPVKNRGHESFPYPSMNGDSSKGGSEEELIEEETSRMEDRPDFFGISTSSSRRGDGGHNAIPGLQISEELPLPPFFFSGLDFPVPSLLRRSHAVVEESCRSGTSPVTSRTRFESFAGRKQAKSTDTGQTTSSLYLSNPWGGGEMTSSTTIASAFSLLFGPFSGGTEEVPVTDSKDREKGTISSSPSTGVASSVVLPCVSLHCRMMVAATKGSAALRELFQLQAIERKNKDVMDTTVSNLTNLLQPSISSSSKTNEMTASPTFTSTTSSASSISRSRGCISTIASGGERSSAIQTTPAIRYRVKSLMGNEEHVEERKEEEEKDEHWHDIQRVRRALPIFQCKSALLRVIGENAVTIVVGETGSGKTTQLVQYLYEAGYTRKTEENDHDEDDESTKRSRNTVLKDATKEADNKYNQNNDNRKTNMERTSLSRGCRRIACTQPRRLAAVGVARRVSEEVGCALGSTVGYSIHLDDVTSKDTHIQFMTDGLLLRHLTRDPDLLAYNVIMLDEAHERSMDTDVLMGVLKGIVARREGGLKLIVASATLDADKFSRFFHNAPCFYIPGRMFMVKEIFAPDPVADYVAEAVFRVCQLHLQMPLTGVVSSGEKRRKAGPTKGSEASGGDSGEAVGEKEEEEGVEEEKRAMWGDGEKEKHDILVFMTGKDDVMGTCELIHRRLSSLNPEARRTLLLLPCLSEGGASLSVRAVAAPRQQGPAHADGNEEEMKAKEEKGIRVGVLDETPPGFRKCVVATNVAETSLTIDGVRYVIDAGFMKTNVYRPSLGMNTLQRYPISHAQANQRKGRAGRTAEGVCFRLYTQRQWEEEMLKQSVPELQRSSMDSVVLLLKNVLDRGRGGGGGGRGGRNGEAKSEEKGEIQENGARGKRDTIVDLPHPLSQGRERMDGGVHAMNRPLLPPLPSLSSSYSSSLSSSDAQWQRNALQRKKDAFPPSLRDFEFIDPPPPVTIQRSMWTLYLLGFLDPVGRITSVGRQALDFPMSPMLAKLVLEGGLNDCLTEVCQIVAMLCADPKHLFETPKGKEEVAHRQHGMFKVLNSDHLTYLHVFTEYIGHGGGGGSGNGGGPKMVSASAREWTRKHYLHLPTLQRAVEIYEQVMERARHIFPEERKRPLYSKTVESNAESVSSSPSHPLYSRESSMEEGKTGGRQEGWRQRSGENNTPNNTSRSTGSHTTSAVLQASMDRTHRWERTRRCLAHSFFLQSAQRSGDDWSMYRPLFHTGVPSQLHPSSSMGNLAEAPLCVVYHDLLSLTVNQEQSSQGAQKGGMTSFFSSSSSSGPSGKKENKEIVSVHKEYLMTVTEVDPAWLVEASQGMIDWRDPILRRQHQETLQMKEKMEVLSMPVPGSEEIVRAREGEERKREEDEQSTRLRRRLENSEEGSQWGNTKEGGSLPLSVRHGGRGGGVISGSFFGGERPGMMRMNNSLSSLPSAHLVKNNNNNSSFSASSWDASMKRRKNI